MPGGGLISLVAYGAQNVLLSGNPDFTYFYKTYKKYAHFAEESVTFAMDGPTDFPYQSSVQLRARVDRVGDLLSDVYFSFQIPAIYSKYKDNFVKKMMLKLKMLEKLLSQKVNLKKKD